MGRVRRPWTTGRSIKVERLGVEQAVEPLYPPRVDELYTYHLAVFLLPDVLRAALFISLCVHPLQVLVIAELVSVLDTFLESACIRPRTPAPALQ